MNGILIVNKPLEFTSNDVVQKVKKIVKEKVGHTGTLDPMATGVLPLLIGKGTLCSKYLINHDKTYNVVLELGKQTDTADREGNIIKTAKVQDDTLNKENIEKVLQSLVGKQEQIPPIYSAIKVKGKKLYEYARKGIDVEIKPRQIEIYETKLIHINKENKQIEFDVSCSKGTYIRSLCEEIASRLGTIGFMAKLNREKVGEFTLKQSVTLEELEKKYSTCELIQEKNNTFFISIEELFKNKNKIELNEKQYKLIINGVRLTRKNYTDDIYKLYYNKQFIGTGIIKEGLLKRDIII